MEILNQRYVIDSCAMLDFWGSIPGYRRVYDIEVASFKAIWEQIAHLVESGNVVIPEVIYKEVDETTSPDFHKWLVAQKKLMVGYEDCLSELAEIVNEFKFYTSHRASFNDSIIIAIAKHHGLTVVTSERKSEVTNYKKPMIPNVCEFFKVDYMSLPEFLKTEGI